MSASNSSMLTLHPQPVGPTWPSAAVLGLGTAPWMAGYGLGGGDVEDPERLLREAVAAGVRDIDTAPGYGDAEGTLGRLASWLAQHQVRVYTKLARHAMPQGLEPSLRRLHHRPVHAALVHNFTASDAIDAVLIAHVRQMVEGGQAVHAGVSTYGVEAARAALTEPWCDIVQVEHSLLNPSVITAVRRLKRPGQQLVARSVLCQGLLSARRAAANLTASARTRLETLDGLARDWGCSLPDLAIRFALDTPGVDIVLVGIRSREELQAAISAWRRPPLTDEQRATLEPFDASSEAWSHPEQWPRP